MALLLMAPPWAVNAFCVKDPNQVVMVRERRAFTKYYVPSGAMSAPVGKDGGILNIAFHHDVSIRPVFNLRVVCWVDLHAIGSA
eukprot:4869289-Pyramimonas_sp.AAC.1